MVNGPGTLRLLFWLIIGHGRFRTRGDPLASSYVLPALKVRVPARHTFARRAGWLDSEGLFDRQATQRKRDASV